jgi:hypothetical protein
MQPFAQIRQEEPEKFRDLCSERKKRAEICFPKEELSRPGVRAISSHGLGYARIERRSHDLPADLEIPENEFFRVD